MATQKECSLCLKHYQQDLFKNKNLGKLAVVAERDGAGKATGIFYIEAGVYSLAQQEAALSRFDIKNIDPTKAVPSRLAVPEGAGPAARKARFVDVSIVETDRIQALSFTNRRRPAGGGDSIGLAARNSAGTLGSRVTANGKEGFLITNWHVAHAGAGSKGAHILQQGRLDGGQNPADKIGGLFWWALNEHLDAAVVQADVVSSLTYTMRCWGPVTDIASPRVGMRVKKCGRTSEATSGDIRSVNASVRVDGYPGGERLFTDQIEMTFMLSAGDSGSLLLTNDNKVVGLCFAGSSARSYANKFTRAVSLASQGKCINPDGSEMAIPAFEIGFGQGK